MSSPLVSVIVPCYKQAHFLNEALQSVLDQSYENWECIIVNDGSPDHTEEVAKQWCNKDKRFVYKYKLNGGLSSARNAGIAICNGDFVLPLDSDDVLHKSYLQKLVPILNGNSKLGVVSCFTYFFRGTISNISYVLKPKGHNYKDLLYGNQLVATSLYRKSSWEMVGGYDEAMKTGFEDWEFWISITKNGLNYHIEKEPLFYYRKAKQSMLVQTTKYHAEATKEYIYKKHKLLYIEDFENCLSELFYDLKTSRNSERKIKNSLEYKLSKVLMKPYRIIEKIVKGK